nr:hypothetical protein 10 [bacterium]
MSRRAPKNWSRKWLILEKLRKENVTTYEAAWPASYFPAYCGIPGVYPHRLHKRGWLYRKRWPFKTGNRYVYWLSTRALKFREKHGSFLGPKNPYDRGYHYDRPKISRGESPTH